MIRYLRDRDREREREKERYCIFDKNCLIYNFVKDNGKWTFISIIYFISWFGNFKFTRGRCASQ